MPTNRNNQRSWARSYASFTGACRKQFAFLLRQGFVAEVSVRPGEAAVSFVRADDGAAVEVLQEYTGEPWVTVRAQGRSAGLHRLIARLEPAYRAARPAKGADAVVLVAYYARFLRRHARDVLGPRTTPPPPTRGAPRR